MLFSPQREDLSSQFSHMTLNQQSLGETSDMSNYYLHGAPPTHSYTQPQQNYAQPYPADSYMSSGMTLAMPTASPTQTCGQQSNQVLKCTEFPTSFFFNDSLFCIYTRWPCY